MKIITLVENTSLSAEYKNKHGLCFYIETEKHKILFDLGTDKLFLENAKKLGVDLSAVDTVVISHGHKDHGGALKLFLENNATAKIYIRESAFMPHYTKALGIPIFVGLDDALKEHKQIILTGGQVVIDEELQLFSEVENRECYSHSNRALYTKREKGFTLDAFEHEQSLMIREKDKFILFGGCAHTGIINIQHKAEQLLDRPLSYVISGFHLYNPVSKKGESEALITEIAYRLVNHNTRYYTCHCTGKEAFKLLKSVMGEKINYLSTGSILEI